MSNFLRILNSLTVYAFASSLPFTVSSSTALPLDVDIVGTYIGRVTVSEQFRDEGYGPLLKYWDLKAQVDYSATDDIYIFQYPFESKDRIAPSDSPQFSFEDYYTHKTHGSCKAVGRMTIIETTAKTALVKVYSHDECKDGAVATGTYEGRISRRPLKAFGNFRGDAVIKKVTTCFEIKKATSFDWDIYDTGGFLVNYRLSVENCSSGRRMPIASINLNRSKEFYRSGTAKINNPGRYRFHVSSTGKWEIDVSINW